MPDAVTHALVEIEECCNHFIRVVAVGTEDEMQERQRSWHSDSGFAAIIAEVEGV